MKVIENETSKSSPLQPRKILTAEGYKRRYILPVLNKRSKKAKAAA